MARTKQLALAALIALALAAGAASVTAPQQAGGPSAESVAAKDSFDLTGRQAVEQVAGSRGLDSVGREST